MSLDSQGKTGLLGMESSTLWRHRQRSKVFILNDVVTRRLTGKAELGQGYCWRHPFFHLQSLQSYMCCTLSR